jgi:predicted exporter
MTHCEEDLEPLFRPLAPFEERFERNKRLSEQLELERQQAALATAAARLKVQRRLRWRSMARRVAPLFLPVLGVVAGVVSAGTDLSLF